MRLFVGLPVPPDLAAQLAKIAHTISLPRARWSEPDRMHITLVFLGQVIEGQLTAIRHELETLEFPALHLAVTELGTFANAGVFFARVESTPALKRLQASTSSRLERLGFATEKRPYQPHITLARSRSALHCTSRRLLGSLPFRADAVHLYRSVPTANGGPLYEILYRVPARRPD